MKKAILFFAVLCSVSCFSQKGDSLSEQPEKAKSDSIYATHQTQQPESDKPEMVLKSEMEEMENFYKARIDKLQTLLIGACGSSVLVIIAAFYMLNKKKIKDKSNT